MGNIVRRSLLVSQCVNTNYLPSNRTQVHKRLSDRYLTLLQTKGGGYEVLWGSNTKPGLALYIHCHSKPPPFKLKFN